MTFSQLVVGVFTARDLLELLEVADAAVRCMARLQNGEARQLAALLRERSAQILRGAGERNRYRSAATPCPN